VAILNLANMPSRFREIPGRIRPSPRHLVNRRRRARSIDRQQRRA
jgi:hypothetical protein